MRPRPRSAFRKTFGVAWFKVKTSNMMFDNFLHCSQPCTNYRRSGGEGLHDGHRKVLIAFAGQYKEAGAFHDFLGLTVVYPALKANGIKSICHRIVFQFETHRPIAHNAEGYCIPELCPGAQQRAQTLLFGQSAYEEGVFPVSVTSAWIRRNEVGVDCDAFRGKSAADEFLPRKFCKRDKSADTAVPGMQSPMRHEHSGHCCGC